MAALRHGDRPLHPRVDGAPEVQRRARGRADDDGPRLLGLQRDGVALLVEPGRTLVQDQVHDRAVLVLGGLEVLRGDPARLAAVEVVHAPGQVGPRRDPAPGAPGRRGAAPAGRRGAASPSALPGLRVRISEARTSTPARRPVSRAASSTERPRSSSCSSPASSESWGGTCSTYTALTLASAPTSRAAERNACA